MTESPNGLPEVTANAGIYHYLWPDYKVEMTLDRLREHGDNLSAEIVVRSSQPGISPHLHHARQNLTSTAAKRTLIKVLNEQASGLPWVQLVEQACVLTLRKHREGEPIELIGSLKRRGPAPWLLSPLLVEGEVNLIYGPGGSSKSYLAVLAALLVSAGHKHSGLDARQGDVLYLDYETSQDEINDRASLLQAGIGIQDVSFFYRRCAQSVADDIEWIQRKVVDGHIALVIVDSVRAALGAGGIGDASDSAIRYLTALRSLRVTSLSIDHVAKGDLAEGPYGSIYKFNYARNVWELKKQTTPGSNEMVVGLYHRKMNNGQLLKPLGLKWTFHTDKVCVESMDPKADPVLAKGVYLEERAYAELKHGDLTTTALAGLLNCNKDSLRVILNRHSELFTRPTEKTWGILSRETGP